MTIITSENKLLREITQGFHQHEKAIGKLVVDNFLQVSKPLTKQQTQNAQDLTGNNLILR